MAADSTAHTRLIAVPDHAVDKGAAVRARRNPSVLEAGSHREDKPVDKAEDTGCTDPSPDLVLERVGIGNIVQILAPAALELV